MKRMLILVGLLALAPTGCGKKKNAAPPPPLTNGSFSSGNPITAPVDYLGAVGAAKKSAERSLDLSSLIQAIQLFNATEERMPASLDELVATRYIARLPVPPPGMKLVYDPRRGVAGFVRQQP